MRYFTINWIQASAGTADSDSAAATKEPMMLP
jgi:hypothetical protein